METSSRHIVTLALASCAFQLIHLTPRPAVFSFDNLAIPNGVHSLVVDAPRFFHSIECVIFFQHYTRPRCCCTCSGCAGSSGCLPVLGQPHFASPFVRDHFFSVAPQHSDFTLQHHFSCAVKSDFNESRSSGQYFRLCRMRGASLSAYTAVGAITCTPIHWSTRRTQVTSCTHPPGTAYSYPLWTELRFLFSAVENGCCSSKFHNTTGLRPASVIGRGPLVVNKTCSDHTSGRKPGSQFFASGTFQFGLVTF